MKAVISTETKDAALLLKLRYLDAPDGLFGLKVFLNAVISSELLRDMYRNKLETAEGEALLSGCVAMKFKADEYADCLTRRGQLLFAWSGTNALQGGAV